MYELSSGAVKKLYAVLEELENLYPHISGVTKGAYDHKTALNLLGEVEQEINYHRESLLLELSSQELEHVFNAACQPVCPLCESELKHVEYDLCGGESINYFRGYSAYCKKCKELREVESDNPLGFIALGVMNGYDDENINFEVVHRRGEKSTIQLRHYLDPAVLEFYSKLRTVLEIIAVEEELVCIRSFI